MTDCPALIADLQAADEGSRELDARIAVISASHGIEQPWDDFISFRVPHKFDMCETGTYWRSARSGMSLHTAEPYTTSTDAAIALCDRLLPNAEISFDRAGTCGAVISHNDLEHPYSAEAPTPALAIVLAALKAFEAQADA